MTYALDGVAFPIRVLSEADAARIRLEVEELERGEGQPIVRRDRLHESCTWARNLVAHQSIVDAVSEVLGPEVRSWGTLLLRKQPHDPSFVAWHQDSEYAHFLGGTPAVTAWIALSDSTPENGCMRVIPGSHRRRLAHAERCAPGNLLSKGQEIVAEIDEREAIDVVLRPGEMSLHDVSLVHGSRGNTTDSPRTGFIIRYATPAARWSA